MGAENPVFQFLLFIGITLFLSAWVKTLYSPREKATVTPPDTADKDQEIAELLQQCQRLRRELQENTAINRSDFKDQIFEELQTLLVNYPSACKMAEIKPDLPAKNLVNLFIPLANLLQSWGYQPIGQVWENTPYDPQIHQADEDDIAEGEEVYIRFIGYRDGERILAPAKVSRSLPPGV